MDRHLGADSGYSTIPSRDLEKEEINSPEELSLEVVGLAGFVQSLPELGKSHLSRCGYLLACHRGAENKPVTLWDYPNPCRHSGEKKWILWLVVSLQHLPIPCGHARHSGFSQTF